MQKRDFETCQKRFRDFEILPKFSETHVFRGTIRLPFCKIVVSSSNDGRDFYFVEDTNTEYYYIRS